MKEIYSRAQQVLLADKFKGNKQDFFKELTRLVSAYVEFDGMTVETITDNKVSMVITVSLK